MSLPPCVVCGKPVQPPSWASTLNEPEAAELLGRAPSGKLSVIDPGNRKRRWVGHEDCTGMSLRTADRSAWELLERLEKKDKRLATERHATARGLLPSAAFRKSDKTCAQCGQVIPYVSTRPLPMAHWGDRELMNYLAWRCTGCTLWLCHKCGHGTPGWSYGGGHSHALAHFDCRGRGAFRRVGITDDDWQTFTTQQRQPTPADVTIGKFEHAPKQRKKRRRNR